MLKKAVYPPNCEVRDSNPPLLIAFTAKQREVHGEYGFWLGVKRRTAAEEAGYGRYMRDWQRRYREANREARAAYRHEYWEKVQKRGFDSKAKAYGDERGLKLIEKRRLKAERRKREEEIRKKYGFEMRIAPRTPEEAAGKARYKEDMRKAYLERNRERIEARMKSYNERRKEENEKRFQKGILELAAKDPAAAEKLRKKHEKLRWIRSLSHEERVRYVQQKLYDRLKARAEREAAIAAAKAKREADEKARRKAIRNGTAKLLRYDRRAIERHAKAVAAEKRRERLEASRSRRAAEKALAEKYRLEREANLRAYLASKNRRAEGEGMP